MTVAVPTQRLVRGTSPASEIEAVANAVLAELTDPGSRASTAVARVGLDPAALAEVRVSTSESEQGADPWLTTIVVWFLGMVTDRVAEALWNVVLLPRIKSKLGADAVGPEVREPDHSDR